MAKNKRISGAQDWENRYAYDAMSENADQTEWKAVINESAHFSAGTIDDVMSEAGDDLTDPGARFGDRLQGSEVIQEALQGTEAELLLERKELLGDAYPFEVEGNSLVYRPSTGLQIYELLLGICQAPSLTAAPYCELPRLFEHLSKLAGIGYLGPGACGYRTGWPRPSQVSHFKALIEDLKKESGNHLAEWQWCPDEHLPDNPAPRFVKEEGLDVVIWRCWNDLRAGQLYLVGQCACGGDWLEKDGDLDFKKLTQWFKLPRVEPMRSFFTPRYAVRHLLNELSYKAGLVFDRVRIVQALRASHIADELAHMEEQISRAIEIAKGLST